VPEPAVRIKCSSPYTSPIWYRVWRVGRKKATITPLESCRTMSVLLELGRHRYWRPSGPLNTREPYMRGSVRTRSAIGNVFLPITTRPRPPLAAHSSFATRSSLLGRIARHSVVTLCPLAVTVVWKRYRTPQELKRTLSRGSWLVQDRMSLDAVLMVCAKGMRKGGPFAEEKSSDYQQHWRPDFIPGSSARRLGDQHVFATDPLHRSGTWR